MIYGMDKEYADCCKDYIRKWIVELGVENYQITDEVIEYMIEKGGDGLREVEVSFKKVVETAKEYKIEVIDKEYIDTVLF